MRRDFLSPVNIQTRVGDGVLDVPDSIELPLRGRVVGDADPYSMALS